MKLTLITGNQDKLNEFKALLAGYDIEKHKPAQEIPEVQDEGIDGTYIVKHKAHWAAQYLGSPVIVEDTNLCFDALYGSPGPYIKCFMKRTANALREQGRDASEQSILDAIASTVQSTKIYGAQAIAHIGYCAPGEEPLCFTGVTEGQIVYPRGKGFGWDPIFEPKEQPGGLPWGKRLTFGEMTPEQKNAVSHRYRALQVFKEALPELVK